MTPERRELLDSLASEILHNYARGRRLVGVDGAEAERTAAFADDLAAALRAAGAQTSRSPFGGAEGFRERVVLPFRAGEGDALLVVDGPLLATTATEFFATTLWLDADGTGIGSGGVRTRADAIVDLHDPDRPVRRYSDWCVVPRR